MNLPQAQALMERSLGDERLRRHCLASAVVCAALAPLGA